MPTSSQDMDVLDANVQQLLNTLQEQVRNAGPAEDTVARLRDAVEKQHRAHRRGQEECSRFELAVEAGQAGVVEWDLRANKVWWNDCAYRIHGYVPRSFEPTFQFWLSQIHPEDRKRMEAEIEACFQERREEIVSEYRIVRPDGEVRWVQGTGRFKFDASGVAESFTGIALDITERKQTQEALARSEAELREAQRVAQVGSWTWDLDSDTVTWSEEIYRVSGRHPGIPVPKYALHAELYTPESWSRLGRAVEEALRSGTPYELDLEVVQPDGTTRWIIARCEPVRDATGRVVKLRGTTQDITERKRMETALQAARDYAQNLIATANAMIVQLDVQGNIRLINQAGERITGYTREELENRNWFDTVVPRARYPEVWDEFQRLLAGGLPRNFENPVLTKTGEERFIAWQNSEVRERGQITGVIAFGVDITQRRQAEDALRRSDATLRRLKEANIIGIIQGEEQRITDANEIFLRMLGYSREELETKQLLYPKITPQEYASLDEHALQGLRSTGAIKPYEKEYFRKDGSRVPVLIGGARIGDAPLQWICFVMDMAEQKRAESERFKLAALVQNSNDFIGLADFDGTALFLNDGARRLVGLDPGEPVPPLAEFLFPDDRAFYVQEIVPRILRGERWTGEFAFRHLKTQEPISVLSDCFTIHDPKTAKPICIATVTRDIREQKRAQAAIQRAKDVIEQASQAKDRFIAALSHELRTPLTPVLVAVQVMDRDPALTSEQRDEIHMVQRNVALEARLIDDLLDLTRISRGKMELHLGPVDMHLLLQQVVEICDSDLRSKHLRFTMELAAAHHHVLGDAARLQQAAWNLLKNAIKFTPSGGSITLRTDQPAEDRLAITFSDTGVGIEPESLPRIFNAFEQGDIATTRDFGGLGLGLAISKEIVDLHGGTLTAWSQGKGLGATFRMEMVTSLAAETQGPRGEGRLAQHAGRRSGRILVVEDHTDTRTLMAKVLRKRGYEVRTAESVAEAYRMATTESVDLIVCDIGLPDGSGLDLMRQLVATNPSTKAIALSGFGMEEDVDKSRRAGFLEHLTKPVDLNLLEETVDRVLQTQAEPA